MICCRSATVNRNQRPLDGMDITNFGSLSYETFPDNNDQISSQETATVKRSQQKMEVKLEMEKIRKNYGQKRQLLRYARFATVRSKAEIML